MPETSVHEYGYLLLCEYDVGVYCPAIRQANWIVLSKSQSSAVQKRSDLNLRLGIDAAVGAHLLRRRWTYGFGVGEFRQCLLPSVGVWQLRVLAAVD